MKKVLIVLAATIALTACGSRTTEEARALLSKPDIITLGTFDGCEVKYVDRGFREQSFYLAKCGNTSTTSRFWLEQQGKTQVTRTSTVITQDIDKLQAEKIKAEQFEQAMSKLSPQDKKALGIQ